MTILKDYYFYSRFYWILYKIFSYFWNKCFQTLYGFLRLSKMSLYNARKLKRIIERDKSENGRNVLKLRKGVDNRNNNLFGYDPRLLLDKKYQVSSSGNHFYEVGLSLFRNGGKERKCYYNPLFIFVLTLLMQFRWFVSLIIPDQYEGLHIFIADFSHILNIKFHMNPALIFLFFIIIISQLINFRDYKRGVGPTYLKPFAMMSGQCSPADIGLFHEKDVHMMVKILRIGVFLIQIFMTSILGMCKTLCKIIFNPKIS